LYLYFIWKNLKSAGRDWVLRDYLPTLRADPVVRDEPGTLPDVCPDHAGMAFGVRVFLYYSQFLSTTYKKEIL